CRCPWPASGRGRCRQSDALPRLTDRAYAGQPATRRGSRLGGVLFDPEKKPVRKTRTPCPKTFGHKNKRQNTPQWEQPSDFFRHKGFSAFLSVIFDCLLLDLHWISVGEFDKNNITRAFFER